MVALTLCSAMRRLRHGKRTIRPAGDERVVCPACAMTLPLAILGPRHCPRCAVDREVLVRLRPYDGGTAG